MNTTRERERLLESWSRYLVDAARQGAITGKPITTITQAGGIAGPRAGALEIYCGLDAGRLMAALIANDAAMLRPTIPWSFPGAPQVYMSGPYLRVEAGWPPELSETMIRLSELNPHPYDDGRWIVGKNEMGRTVVASLNDRTPHWLISGGTGSGKSVALRGAVKQLSHDPRTRLVLLDGKMGEGLGPASHLPGIVGPVATDGAAIRAALTWAAVEMVHRYEVGGHDGRVVVVFDEFQEFADDGAIVGLMRKLAAQGRAAGVHLLAATQHPTVDAFGDKSTRRNLTGKLALRVEDPDASRVAVGGKTPRADRLLGAGDAYTIAPARVQRVQVAYIGPGELQAGGPARPELDEWPEPDPESAGRDLPADRGPGRPSRPFGGAELAIAIISMTQDEGRPALKARLERAGIRPGGVDRLRELMAIAREATSTLDREHYELLFTGEGDDDD
jgi:hypothetical protein